MKYGGVEVQLLIFLTLSLDGQWLASHSMGKEPPLPIGQVAGLAPDVAGKEKTPHLAWNQINIPNIL